MKLFYRKGKTIRSFEPCGDGQYTFTDTDFPSISAAKRHSRTVCGLNKVANVDRLPAQPH